jgi:hypothetical protein
MFVIKFTDGSYNQARGFPCRLAEATRYATRAEAEYLAQDFSDVDGVFEIEASPDFVPFFSATELADMIEASVKEMKVLTPSMDYYARAGDYSEDTITYIDPELLLNQLRGTT